MPNDIIADRRSITKAIKLWKGHADRERGKSAERDRAIRAVLAIVNEESP